MQYHLRKMKCDFQDSMVCVSQIKRWNVNQESSACNKLKTLDETDTFGLQLDSK